MSLNHTDFLTIALSAYMLFLLYREYIPFMNDRKIMESLGQPEENFELNRSRVNTKMYLIIAVFVVVTNVFELNLVDRIFVAVMMIHTLFLWYQASRKVLVFKSGIYFNSRYVTWQALMKITLTDNKLELVLEPNASIKLVNRDLKEARRFKTLVHEYQTSHDTSSEIFK